MPGPSGSIRSVRRPDSRLVRRQRSSASSGATPHVFQSFACFRFPDGKQGPDALVGVDLYLLGAGKGAVLSFYREFVHPRALLGRESERKDVARGWRRKRLPARLDDPAKDRDVVL